MRLRVFSFLAVGLLGAGLASCGRFDRAQRPAWRDQAEASCLARGLVSESPSIQTARAIEGPGICGLNHPFKVYALAGGTVRLNSASILDCSMIPMLDAWIKDIVQPDALARFGEPVAQINTMGTYACRGINNRSGAGLSEHAFGNAMDVGGFVLASGRVLTVTSGWSGPDIQEVGFLRDAHAGACNYFTTVLGPGYNVFHYNHVHMDLAMHGNTSRGLRRYCKPVPGQQIEAPKLDDLPDPPPIEEEMDMARAATPRPSDNAGGGSTFVASVPETSPTYRPLPARDGSAVLARSLTPAVTAAPLALAPMQPRVSSGLRDPDQDGEAPAPEGVPADWDMTSLIKSRATR